MPTWLSWIDIVYIGVGLLFAWGGYQKGFSKQIAHILTFLMSGLFLFFAYPPLYDSLHKKFPDFNGAYLIWILFITLLLLSFLIFKLFTLWLSGKVKATLSERDDHIYGCSLGLIRGLLFGLLAMILLVILDPARTYEPFSKKSYMGKFVCKKVIPKIQPRLNRDAFKSDIRRLQNRMLSQPDAGIID